MNWIFRKIRKYYVMKQQYGKASKVLDFERKFKKFLNHKAI